MNNQVFNLASLSAEQLAELNQATRAKLRQLKTGPLTRDAIAHQDLTSRGGTKYTSLTVSGVMRRGLSAENWLRLLGKEELNVKFLNELRTEALSLITTSPIIEASEE